MSDPLGVEEREALRDAILDWERNGESGELLGSPADCWAAMEHLAPTIEQLIAARVDRLTEALEAAERVQVIQYQHEAVCDWVTNNSWCNCGLDEAWEKAVQTEAHHAAMRLLAENETLTARAERAEADLADEKRRHAELRAGVEALGNRWAASNDRGWVSNQADELLDLLLDTATEESA